MVKLEIKKPKANLRVAENLIVLWVNSTLDALRLGYSVTPPVVPQKAA